ncbi:hypothetical protein BB558_004171 [Smittium angustum]|uniref:Peptidase S1 domain-containing protein n=2 Tax=Smittium angustum TaxID=133377 RepID=A0A2U1J457_SMIAN|nr:hypothetical protein BB558_004171 [Smittium angustum]
MIWKLYILSNICILGFANGYVPPPRLSDSSITFGKSPRIINGQTASTNEFPFAASLQITFEGNGFSCGGSIINEKWILTAAHCMYPGDRLLTPNEVKVGYGNSNREKQTFGTVSNIFVMPGYNRNDTTPLNDITLLELSSPIPIDNTTTSVIQFRDVPIPPQTSTTAIGWGAASQDPNSGAVDDLLKVNLLVGTPDFCKSIYPQYTENGLFICTSTDPGGFDTCYGDSGGPLLYNEPSGKQSLSGVLSFGDSIGNPSRPVCGDPKGASFFTRPIYVIDFISQTTRIDKSYFVYNPLGTTQTPISSSPQSTISTPAGGPVSINQCVDQNTNNCIVQQTTGVMSAVSSTISPTAVLTLQVPETAIPQTPTAVEQQQPIVVSNTLTMSTVVETNYQTSGCTIYMNRTTKIFYYTCAPTTPITVSPTSITVVPTTPTTMVPTCTNCVIPTSITVVPTCTNCVIPTSTTVVPTTPTTVIPTTPTTMVPTCTNCVIPTSPTVCVIPTSTSSVSCQSNSSPPTVLPTSILPTTTYKYYQVIVPTISPTSDTCKSTTSNNSAINTSTPLINPIISTVNNTPPQTPALQLPTDQGNVQSTLVLSQTPALQLPTDQGNVESSISIPENLILQTPTDQGNVQSTLVLSETPALQLPTDQGNVESSITIPENLILQTPTDQGNVQAMPSLSETPQVGRINQDEDRVPVIILKRDLHGLDPTKTIGDIKKRDDDLDKLQFEQQLEKFKKLIKLKIALDKILNSQSTEIYETKTKTLTNPPFIIDINSRIILLSKPVPTISN